MESRPLRRLLVTSTAAGLLICSGCSSSSGRDPDPRGELLHALTEVRSALPPAADMTVEDSTTVEPQRDRCTTSDVTGYDPATVEIGFAAFWPASRVVAWVDQAMRTRGWRAVQVGGESARWQKPVAGETATTSLLAGRTGPTTPLTWSLVATAPAKVEPISC